MNKKLLTLIPLVLTASLLGLAQAQDALMMVESEAKELSEEIMLNAPRSCKMSSAAMVSRRMRDSAKATSSAIAGSR